MVLITVKSCVRDSYGPEYTLYSDCFLFSSSFRTFNASTLLICGTFVSNGSLGQSVERGSNNGKVLCSRLIRTRFHFLFGLLSLFK